MLYPLLYQLVAVMPSQFFGIATLPLIISKPEGVFDCKMFLFFVFFFTKDVFFFRFFVLFLNSKSKYTGVPLHICTDVNRKWGEMTRGGINGC